MPLKSVAYCACSFLLFLKNFFYVCNISGTSFVLKVKGERTMDSYRAKEKIETVLREHADMIYRIAYQNTRSRADADDIFQEVCLCLVTKNAPLDDENHLKSWLIRVTLNQCKNLHKSAWHSRTEGLSDNILYEQEDIHLLDEVRKLPPNHRNAVYLYYYEGFSVAEIAELMGTKPNTVSSWLLRGRKKLKQFLSE